MNLGGLVGLVQPGQAIYIAGGLTPPAAFVAQLQADPERSAGLRITTTLAPGFTNAFDFARLHPSAVVSGPLMRPDLAKAQRAGQYRALPLTYAGFLRHLQGQDFDFGVVQVAPPDAQGRHSLGPSVEFVPPALARCRKVLALVNPLLPALPYSVSLPADRITAQCEMASALPHFAVESDAATEVIGRSIAALVPDGSTLQTGLGKVPGAVARHLGGHRRIRIHSGMVSDGLLDLARAGALDEGGGHRAALVGGSQALYDWLPEAQGLRLVGCDQIYARDTFAGLQRFVTVNSALEVDLFGQCNLEHQSGRAVSGAGGAPDFARIARTCEGGMSIVALNATYASGTRSRIVAALDSGAMVSLSRLDVDVVVTEFGVADLRRASVHERAWALMAVAAPAFREDLQRAWSERADRL